MNFNAKQLKNEIVAWIRDWFEKNGAGCNAIVGISGGKDSSAVAALCAEALGADRVIGILMPNGEQFDIDMSKLLVAHLGIRHYVFNIKDAYGAMTTTYEAVTGGELMPLGFTGPALGKTLNVLLDRVMRGELANEREILLNAAEKERNG